MPTKLNLKFKGRRDYLHGTDIFSAMCMETGAKRAIRQNLNKPMYQSISYDELGSTHYENIVGTFSADGNTWVLLQEEDNVKERYDYDEEAVASHAIISNHRASGPVIAATPIETIVAYNKLLLNSIFGKSEWWFTRIDIDSEIRTASDIHLEYLENRRLYKSSISVDGEKNGLIYFYKK